MTDITYPDIQKSNYLYVPCMGLISNKEGMVTVDEFRFLEFPSKDEGAPECLTFGGNALTLLGFAPHCLSFSWISVASVVAAFPLSEWAQIKESLTQIAGDRNFSKIRCSRSSAAQALRGYIRRRDRYLMEQANPKMAQGRSER